MAKNLIRILSCVVVSFFFGCSDPVERDVRRIEKALGVSLDGMNVTDVHYKHILQDISYLHPCVTLIRISIDSTGYRNIIKKTGMCLYNNKLPSQWCNDDSTYTVLDQWIWSWSSFDASIFPEMKHEIDTTAWWTSDIDSSTVAAAFYDDGSAQRIQRCPTSERGRIISTYRNGVAYFMTEMMLY